MSCSQNKNNYILKIPKTGLYKTSTLYKNNAEYKQILSGVIGKDSEKLIMVLGGGSGPKSFNTWASTDATTSSVADLMYVGLLEKDPWNGQFLPHLAKDFKIQNNGRKIIITLRKGLKWSDNQPITSKDVLFTWNVILKQGFERLGVKDSLMIENRFPKVYSLDDKTIVFETHKVFAPFLDSLSYPIAPVHYFEKFFKGKTLEEQRNIFSSLLSTDSISEDFPVSGPYKISAYKKQERIEFKRNPNYFVFDSKGHRLPYFKKLIYLIIQNKDLELFKFINAEIPIINLGGENASLLSKVKTKQNIKIYNLGPDNGKEFISFNLSKKSWFSDKRFREALAKAIDRETMINSIYLGMGTPNCLDMNEKNLYFNEKLNNKVCNLKANLKDSEAILKEIGFHKNNKNELLDKEGKLVRFSLYTNATSVSDSFSPRELMATMIKEQWESLGIKVDLKVIEFNNLVSRLTQTGDWETSLLCLTGGSLTEPNSGANVLKSNSRLHFFNLRSPEQKQDNREPWEKEIDICMDKGVSFIDFENRKKYYYRVQEILWEENPMIFLINSNNFIAINNNLKNFEPSVLGGTTYNIDQWWISN